MAPNITTTTSPDDDAQRLIKECYRYADMLMAHANERKHPLTESDLKILRELARTIKDYKALVEKPVEEDTLVVIGPKLRWPPEDEIEKVDTNLAQS